MTTCFQCPKCGRRDFERGPCYVCGGKIDQEVECGVDKAEGFPNVVRDHMAPHFDYAAGQVIRSRTELNAVYATKGLARKSYAEHAREHGSTVPMHKRTVTYPGQRLRRSPGEKRPRFV